MLHLLAGFKGVLEIVKDVHPDLQREPTRGPFRYLRPEDQPSKAIVATSMASSTSTEIYDGVVAQQRESN